MNEAVFTLHRLALELIATKRPTDEILDRLCELVQEIVPNGLATVMRHDAKQDTLTFRNAPSVPECVLEAFGVLTPGPFSGSCGSSVYAGEMVAVEDTATDPRWESLRSVAKQFQIQSCWSVPIFIGETEIAGTFAISRSVCGAPTDDERQLLELAAYLAGVVIRLDNADVQARDQGTLLRAIIDCAEDPIFVKDLEGRYQLVNEAEARHRGLAVEDVVGKTDAELDGSYDLSVVEETDQCVLAREKPVEFEIEVTCAPEGDVRDYLVRKDPLRNADNEVIGVVGISRNLTERRRVERAMQHSQKLESLGILAGGIAHDFNNLLVGVMANASLLEEDDRITSPDIIKSITDIRIASERAAELTGQLLEYAGKRKPSREALSLSELLGEVPDLLSAGIAKNVQLNTQLAADLPAVNADPVQMRQVLMNLVLNASESFEGRGGQIDVCAKVLHDAIPTGRLVSPDNHERGDWVQVTVTDNGCGMDAGTMARIFDPFFSTKSTGHGLGLAAVLGIIDTHGGCLDVASRVGRGTCFTMWLPVDPSLEQPEPVLISENAPAKATKQAAGRILVVEDAPAVASVLCRMLGYSGYETVLAEDGERGLELFEEAGPNAFVLAIIDYTMPGLDGQELARRIREQSPDLPLVLTSGMGEVDARVDCSERFVDAFLSKPFTAGQVLRAIEEARSRREPIGA